MNSIEARTLNQLRQIRTGKVTWHARSYRVNFEYGSRHEGDHIYLAAADWAKLAEDLYVRHRSSFDNHGPVTLTPKGEHLLEELELEDSSEECIHGLGDKSACTICSGKDARQRTADAEAVEWRVFPAKYPGHCYGCNLPINVGDRIAWKEGVAPLHEDCRP